MNISRLLYNIGCNYMEGITDIYTKHKIFSINLKLTIGSIPLNINLSWK